MVNFAVPLVLGTVSTLGTRVPMRRQSAGAFGCAGAVSVIACALRCERAETSSICRPAP